jgi:hypothetical protein
MKRFTTDEPTFERRRETKARKGAYRSKPQSHHPKQCRKRGGVRVES